MSRRLGDDPLGLGDCGALLDTTPWMLGGLTWRDQAALDTPRETDGADVTAAELHTVLSQSTFAYASEHDLQSGVAAALTAMGFTVQREVRLDRRDRIDLLVDGVGIEVKTAGTADALLRQIARYATHSVVRELLVVTTRSRHRALPEVVGGKPCRVFWVGAL